MDTKALMATIMGIVPIMMIMKLVTGGGLLGGGGGGGGLGGILKMVMTMSILPMIMGAMGSLGGGGIGVSATPARRYV
jgi:hypothetical protein